MSDDRLSRKHASILIHCLPLFLAIAVGATLRWWKLGRGSLRFDEGYTAWVISLPPARIVHVIRADTAPPLYYLIMHGWTATFGSSEAALRAFAALCATLTLALLYPVARRMLRDPIAAIAAVAIYAVSVMPVAYAHEARFYALMTLLAVIDLLLALELLNQPRPVWPRILTILAWTASLYTNNMMAVYLAGLAVALLVLPGVRSLRGRLIDLGIVAIPTALLFLPWLPSTLAQSASLKTRFWTVPPNATELLRTIAVLAGVNSYTVGWPLTAALLPAIVVLIVIGLAKPSTRRISLALCAFGLLPIVFAFIQSRVSVPIFIDRAFIPTTLVIPLLILLPFTQKPTATPWNRIALVTVTVFWCAVSIASLPNDYLGMHREPWRAACQYADESPSPSRLLIFIANEGELLFDYYQRHGDFRPKPEITGAPRSFFASDPPQTMSRVRNDADLNSLRSLLDSAGFDQIVLVESHYWFSDPDHRVREELRRRMLETDHRQLDQIDVYRFNRDR
jgi:hypothetical protein